MFEIRYTIRLDSPVLVTAPGGDPNANQTLEFIPGSVIRGAVASQLKQKTEQDFLRLILQDEILYLNAYPLTEQRDPTLPIPMNRDLIKTKEEAKKDLNGAKPDKSKIYFDPKNPSSSDKNLYGVSYEINVHNARNREAGRSTGKRDGGALFRYEALADGQFFAGRILAKSKEDADDICALLKCKTSKLFFGGSQTADYGAVTIIANDPIEYVPSVTITDKRTYIYLESDGIFRHPATGQIGPYFAEALADVTQIENIKHDYLNHDWSGGFNRKWGLPIQQNSIVSKGSTLYIEGNLKEEQVTALKSAEQHGIGERRNEGFGRIIVGPVGYDPQADKDNEFESHWELRYKDDKWPQSEDDVASVVEGSTKVESFINTINSRIAAQEIERYLLSKAGELAQAKATRFRALSNSQIGRMRVRMRDENVQNGNLSGFAHYLKETAKRNTADAQFRKSLIDGINFRKWLIDLAENPTSIWKTIGIIKEGDQNSWSWVDDVSQNAIQKSLIGLTPFQTTEVDAQQYTVRLIETLLTNISNEKRRES